MRQAVRFSRLDLKIHAVSFQGRSLPIGTLCVLDMKNIDAKAIRHKVVSGDCGHASFEYIKKVIELALSKEIDATVTGPISKEAINRAGFHYSGHTEIYGDLTRTRNYAMMLMHNQFRSFMSPPMFPSEKPVTLSKRIASIASSNWDMRT